MTDGSLERLLRRDRAVVLAALAAVAAIAWVYLAWMAAHGGGEEAGRAMGGMATPAFEPWSAGEALAMFAMWAAMMVGMMTPSAAPMLLVYARVARHARERAHPFAPAGWFGAGYLAAWTGFAALATALQWGLEQAALLTEAMALVSRPLAGALLIAAGLYQWTPLKDACLGRCRSPFQFIQSRGGFRGDRRGSLRLGLEHGLFCIGCCWALMGLLFLGGVMSLLWIAGLALLVLAEKAFPGGRHLGRAAGLVFVLAGIGMVAGL